MRRDTVDESLSKILEANEQFAQNHYKAIECHKRLMRLAIENFFLKPDEYYNVYLDLSGEFNLKPLLEHAKDAQEQSFSSACSSVVATWFASTASPSCRRDTPAMHSPNVETANVATSFSWWTQVRWCLSTWRWWRGCWSARRTSKHLVLRRSSSIWDQRLPRRSWRSWNRPSRSCRNSSTFTMLA